VMTSEAALFLLMAAAGSGRVFGIAGGAGGFELLMMTISGVGLAW